MPPSPEPVRIDRFVEKRFGVEITYRQLHPSILGYTRFNVGAIDAIVITSSLDDEDTPSAERRIRSTIAHEAGHCLLHAKLFGAAGGPPDLFEQCEGKHAIMCREVEGEQTKKTKYSWSEYQANAAIGALLLPKPLFLEAIEPFLEVSGLLGLKALPDSRREDAARDLARVFNVNPVVARIRVNEIFGPKNNAQGSL